MIQPKQLLFTRVEPAYSPTRQAGYQIYYASPSLGEEIKKQIEEQVKSFQTNDLKLVRLQFFSLTNGDYALAYSSFIETDPEINDISRRPGIFLCHVLILSLEQLALFGNNPFQVFNKVKFVCDSRYMVQGYDQTTARETELLIDSDSSTLSDRARLWAGQASKLLLLGMSATMDRAKGQQILFIGEQQPIMEMLELLFWVTPASERLSITFNTFVYGLAPKPDLYWAGVSPSRVNGYPNTLIVSSSRSIMTPPEMRAIATGFYQDWFENALKKRDDSILDKIPTAQVIGAAFDQKTRFHLESVDQTVCAEFFTLFSAECEQRLTTFLNGLTNENISNSLFHYIQQHTDIPSLVLWVASERIEDFDLSRLSRGWLAEQMSAGQGIRGGDWNVLAKLAKQIKDPVIGFWVAAKQEKIDLEKEYLDGMTNEDFDTALCLLLSVITPREYVCQKFTGKLVHALQPQLSQLSEENFYDLVSDMVDYHQGMHLGLLASRLNTIENRTLTRIEKRIKKEGEISGEFQKAIVKQRNRLGAPSSFWENILPRKN